MDIAPPNRDLFEVDLSAPDHYAVLDLMCRLLRPKSYLEVGTLHGQTLAIPQCPSIGVDPRFALTHDVAGGKPQTHLYQMTSDDFFRRHDARAVLGVKSIDLFFLDGLHIYEFLLRDFLHAERLAARNSVILMHDCLPLEAVMTYRSQDEYLAVGAAQARIPGWWTGDVWKILPILARHRPDLKIVAIDCPPSGLIAVTNLDPASTVLEERYAGIVEEFAGLDDAMVEEARRAARRVKVSEIDTLEKISRHFWL